MGRPNVTATPSTLHQLEGDRQACVIYLCLNILYVDLEKVKDEPSREI